MQRSNWARAVACTCLYLSGPWLCLGFWETAQHGAAGCTHIVPASSCMPLAATAPPHLCRLHPGRAHQRQAHLPRHLHHEPAGPHPGGHGAPLGRRHRLDTVALCRWVGACVEARQDAGGRGTGGAGCRGLRTTRGQQAPGWSCRRARTSLHAAQAAQLPSPSLCAATMLESMRAPATPRLDATFPSASPEALDLLRRLLHFNPEKRISPGAGRGAGRHGAGSGAAAADRR